MVINDDLLALTCNELDFFIFFILLFVVVLFFLQSCTCDFRMDTRTHTKKNRAKYNSDDKQKQNKSIRKQVGFWGHLLSLRLIGHVPFRTGEIIFAFHVFDINVVVFVFQFAGIGDGVFIPFAASLELVRL